MQKLVLPTTYLDKCSPLQRAFIFMYAVFGIAQSLSILSSSVVYTIYFYLQRTFKIHNAESPLKSQFICMQRLMQIKV